MLTYVNRALPRLEIISDVLKGDDSVKCYDYVDSDTDNAANDADNGYDSIAEISRTATNRRRMKLKNNTTPECMLRHFTHFCSSFFILFFSINFFVCCRSPSEFKLLLARYHHKASRSAVATATSVE